MNDESLDLGESTKSDEEVEQQTLKFRRLGLTRKQL